MKGKIMKLKLNKEITKLQKQMKKQEEQIHIILEKLDQMEPKEKEIKIDK
jgi:hypothetical protein